MSEVDSPLLERMDDISMETRELINELRSIFPLATEAQVTSAVQQFADGTPGRGELASEVLLALPSPANSPPAPVSPPRPAQTKRPAQEDEDEEAKPVSPPRPAQTKRPAQEDGDGDEEAKRRRSSASLITLDDSDEEPRRRSSTQLPPFPANEDFFDAMEPEGISPTLLVETVEQLMTEFPDADANALFARLEQAGDMEAVLAELRDEFASAEEGGEAKRRRSTSPVVTFPNEAPEPAGADRPSPTSLVDAVEELVAEFPDANANALFARLERAPDLETAIAELRAEFATPVLPEEDVAALDEAPGPSTAPVPVLKPENSLVEEVDALASLLNNQDKIQFLSVLDAFQNADPKWVYEKMVQDGMSAEALLEKMMTDSGYPKIAARKKEEAKQRRRAELTSEAAFRAEDYLRLYPDPEEEWTRVDKTVSNLYLLHATAALQMAFPQLTKRYLDKVLAENNNHYYPAQKQVEVDMLLHGGRNTKTSRAMYRKRQSVGKSLDWPATIDEQFFREYQYALFRTQVTEHKEQQAKRREATLAAAAEAGLLSDCPICASDSVLPDELLNCGTEGHDFCADCVRGHAAAQLEEGRARVDCPHGCGAPIQPRLLQGLLSPNLAALLLKRVQKEELKAAGLTGAVECPFCDYMAIVEEEAVRVFECGNPDCLRQSCRDCNEEAHIPLRCDEVEKGDELQMRKLVEEAMAEATIRVCPKCDTRIVKSEGCNKMTCPCGAFICYVCRALLPRGNPYAHFGGANGCTQDTSMAKLHENASKEAGEKAKALYLEQHPNVDPEHVDVAQIIRQAKRRSNVKPRRR